MSHRDSLIKKNKELSKPMDLFNTGFVGAAGGGAALETTGGAESTTSGYKYHVFTTTGSTLTFTTTADVDVDFLLIGGGGGGGGEGGGGGGSGGGLYQSGRTLTASSSPYSIVIGTGGAGVYNRVSPTSTNDGVDSTFDSMTAKGGGSGAGMVASGRTGGSGGGASHNRSGSQASTQGSYSGVTSYGNASASCGQEGQGGGGLYSAPADCGDGLNRNVGGSGIGGTNNSTINTMLSHVSKGVEETTGNWYIGGGGAGSGGYTQARSLGGGGDSGSNYGMGSTGTGGTGIASTGSGGGGGWGSGSTGGVGAAGILILRYLL